MNEINQDIDELTAIVGKVSGESRSLIIASARAVLFGEQAIRKQYGLLPESGQVQMKQAGAGA